MSSEAVIGLPGYPITGIEVVEGKVRISARYTAEILPRLWQQATPDQGQAVAPTTARKLGIEALHPRGGIDQLPMQGVRPRILATIRWDLPHKRKDFVAKIGLWKEWVLTVQLHGE